MRSYFFIAHIFFITLFASYPSVTRAQPSGRIYCPSTQSDTVDFGLILYGDDATREFKLVNSGDAALRVQEFEPWYFLGELPDRPFDFEEFDAVGSPFPIIIPRNDEFTLEIKYAASTDTNRYPLGNRYAALRIGLENPGDEEPIATAEFVLFARKTRLLVDGYDKIVDFDSVYVNPGDSVMRTWRLKNVSDKKIEVFSQSVAPIDSPDDLKDFTISGYGIPLETAPQSIYPWQIYFSPADTGRSEIEIGLSFNSVPDSVDVAAARITGVGVKAEPAPKQIEEADYEIFYDEVLEEISVDVGDVWVGLEREIAIPFENLGNMPFGAKSQKLYKVYNDSPSEHLSFIRELCSDGRVAPLGSDTLVLKFAPKRRGEIAARYLIESDVEDRNISNVPDEAKNFKFRILGTGVAPNITVDPDSIYLGNVVSVIGCELAGDTVIAIKNDGNAPLYIEDVAMPSFFRIEERPDSIAPNESDRIKIRFDPQYVGQEVDTSMIITTNALPPADSTVIKLVAASVPPVSAGVKAPDISAKPGRRISMPIIVNKKNMIYTREYRDRIKFDPSLLKYAGYEIRRTAAEASGVSIDDDGLGELTVYLSAPESSTFERRDTLIFLKFDTFLGERASTPISFLDPRFGDGKCDRVLSIKPDSIDNGFFALDSICGLDEKVGSASAGLFVSEITPNPTATDAEFFVEIPFETPAKIRILDAFGREVFAVFDGRLKKGRRFFRIDCSELTPGVYYCVSETSLIRISKMFVVVK